MLHTPEKALSSNLSPSLESAQKFLGLHLPPALNILLSTQQLTEILPITPLEITPVAESPDPIMGVYNWRGEVLWLVDLGCLLGQTPLFQQRCHQFGFSIIVVQFQSHALGLVVDQIGEVQTIPPNRIAPPKPDSTIDAIAPMFQGCYQSDASQHHWILDIDAVIEQITQCE